MTSEKPCHGFTSKYLYRTILMTLFTLNIIDISA